MNDLSHVSLLKMHEGMKCDASRPGLLLMKCIRVCRQEALQFIPTCSFKTNMFSLYVHSTVISVGIPSLHLKLTFYIFKIHTHIIVRS